MWVVEFTGRIWVTADLWYQCRWKEDSLSSWQIYESLSSWGVRELLSWWDIYEWQLTCDMSAGGSIAGPQVKWPLQTQVHCVLQHCIILQHTATHCNTLYCTSTHCNMLQHTAPPCNVLQHTAACCNTPQHTATFTTYRNISAVSPRWHHFWHLNVTNYLT